MSGTKSVQDEVIIRGIKIVDIGYVTILYGGLGLLSAAAMEKIFGKFDKTVDEHKSTIRIVGEVMGLLWVIGVVSYIAKNIVEAMPFPLDGVYGFRHELVKEVHSVFVLVQIVMYYQSSMKGKLQILYDRFM
jgi:hypothetical protein